MKNIFRNLEDLGFGSFTRISRILCEFWFLHLLKLAEFNGYFTFFCFDWK